jgi:hypothetical protein
MGWRGKSRFAWQWLCIRVRYMVRSAPVLNTMLHSLTILVLYNLMTYPITILVGTEDDQVNSHRTPADVSSSLPASSASETLENYCGGALINLIEQGAVLMACYLVSSLLYLAVLVRCPPRIYYKYALPALAIVTGGSLLVILFLRGALPRVAITIVVSIAQVLPYYINAFTYYVMNTAIKQEYYGLITAFYAFGVQAISFGTSAVLYLSVPVQLLVFVCCGLLAVCVTHGFFMHRLFVAQNWAN